MPPTTYESRIEGKKARRPEMGRKLTSSKARDIYSDPRQEQDLESSGKLTGQVKQDVVSSNQRVDFGPDSRNAKEDCNSQWTVSERNGNGERTGEMRGGVVNGGKMFMSSSSSHCQARQAQNRQPGHTHGEFQHIALGCNKRRTTVQISLSFVQYNKRYAHIDMW